MAAGLSDVGFNLNLAPVVDVNVNPANPIIGKLGRSFSADPQTVEAYAKVFVEAHRAKGVLTALKHFPGHGSSTKDSHKGMADVSKTWSDKELLPYKNLIASGDVDMVMSAHVINDKLSFSTEIPSSLSRATLTGLLRDNMPFKGVVISDDMQMQAITDNISFEDSVLRAVRAGNDILIFANDKHPDPLVPEKVAACPKKRARTRKCSSGYSLPVVSDGEGRTTIWAFAGGAATASIAAGLAEQGLSSSASTISRFPFGLATWNRLRKHSEKLSGVS
ncbi:glycoside hydrolase family 3 protein [Mesorhizobium sp. NZP2298]|uniref:glycoside hydrolase family 3 protein n=1 Tax=Mesorhizobium sp. NZP2298 TaxID=2483403 RepID=UPI0015564008|nr:glycoside hydrolase family 3 protein [Mesorhizobium sp. NZP2298]